MDATLDWNDCTPGRSTVRTRVTSLVMASIRPCSDGRAAADGAGVEEEPPDDFLPGVGDALPTTWMVLPFRIE